LQNVRAVLPTAALQFLALTDGPGSNLKLIERLSEESLEIRVPIAEATNPGIPIAAIPPLTAFYFKFA
jgi:hypothetical protein